MNVSIYTPDRQRLRGLAPQDATILFRALLFAEAGRMRLRNIRISVDETNTADGGIDAFAEQVSSGNAEAGSFHFQLKTGTSFKPWREADLKKELFGSTNAAPKKGTLGTAVKACLDQGGTYVVVCFAHDMQAQKAADAVRLVRRLFASCGYPHARVEVWGTGELAAMMERYPSLCIDLNERSFDGALQTSESWASNFEMRTRFVAGPKQKEVAERIASLLKGDVIQHVRLVGEPGLGKTRLALEAIRAEPTLAAATVYAPQAEDFQASRLFNELLRPDRAYQAVMVIDECDESDRASIFGRLKGRAGIKLITIDHGPDSSSDQLMELVEMPSLRDQEVQEILEGYVGQSGHLHHWVPWCEGSARVAHALGENLARNPDDLLKSPATVDIWKRYIEGYQESRDADQTRTVLEHVALFRKFGFRPPVADEGKFIAKLAQRADPSITLARFTRIVERLVQKRILQGGRTLRIVPKALHIYLWREWWNNQGQAEDLGTLLGEIPGALKRWFSEMLIYANGVEPARQAIRRALAGGALKLADFISSDSGAGFISILAEADPDAAMIALDATFESLSIKDVERLDAARHSLTAALCKLAVHRKHFGRAARLLARLTHGDYSNYSNNTRGSFCGLFQLNQGPTQAPPDERIEVLRELFATARHERRLALEAAKELLNSGSHTRVVGVEHQGLAPTLTFWTPKLWKEFFEAWRAGLALLEEQVREDDVEWQKSLSGAILEAAADMLQFPELEEFALGVLARQPDFPGADLNELAKLLVVRVKHNYQGLPQQTLVKLQTVLDRLGTGSFKRRFERFVCYETYDEDHRQGKSGNLEDDPGPGKKVEEVAREFVELLEGSPADVELVLCAEGHRITKFGAEVAKLSSEPHDWLLGMVGVAAEPATSFGFLSGYLEHLFKTDRDRWETLALALLEGEPSQWRLKSALFSGVSRKVADRVLSLMRKGVAQPDLLRAWAWSFRDDSLTEADFTAIVEFVFAAPERAALAALELAHSWRDVRKRSLSDDLIWKVLSDTRVLGARSDPRAGHHWEELTKGYLARNPRQDVKVLDAVVAFAKSSRVDTMSPMFETAADLAFAAPARAWPVLAKHLADKARARNLIYWLGDGRTDKGSAPIDAFRPADVLDWIGADASVRAPMMVDVLPRTLEGRGGELTRGFLERFGSDRALRADVRLRFCTGSSTGPRSLTYSGKRDAARRWLAATTFSNVRRWAEEFIEEMTAYAEEARIQEEREF
ncbi:hypothetical protein [Variovorax guangxiensis]|uniref:hypothetical protein n=1 Tax=Variovorax guangxiensis TaxID=1775474 RepID=UPI0028562676|nr:hypothetical protein [Variovorax guangxiensis]MDR6857868.1 hypothetical protein [Variovorax guangxiensis]